MSKWTTLYFELSQLGDDPQDLLRAHCRSRVKFITPDDHSPYYLRRNSDDYKARNTQFLIVKAKENDAVILKMFFGDAMVCAEKFKNYTYDYMKRTKLKLREQNIHIKRMGKNAKPDMIKWMKILKDAGL